MLRQILRNLARSPGFTAFVILTLGLGIGANTAVFSVADAFLFKPVPFPRADRLLMLHQLAPGNTTFRSPVTPADFLEFRESSHSYSNVAAYEPIDFNLSLASSPEPIYSALVSANFFDTLDVKPFLGRTFSAGEDQEGKNQVVVLSYGLWQHQFAADSNIVGREIHLDGAPYTVIGVMNRDFRFPVAVGLWSPIIFSRTESADRADHWLRVVARLKDGFSPSEARAELAAIASRLAAAYPQTNRGWGVTVEPIRRFITGDFNRQYSLLLLCSVFFVLLIACANVINLQFARLSTRQKEFAVRSALGATRWQVVRRVLVESTLLALAGALAGLLIAAWTLNLIVTSMPERVARYIAGWQNIQLDLRALVFTIAIAVFAGLVSGIIPALRLRRDVIESLKEASRGSTAGHARQRLRSVLVGCEIAAAMVLLSGAGLMIKGSHSLIQVNREFRPESILTMQIAVTYKNYGEPHQRAAFYDRMLQRLDALPDVASATLVSNVPYGENERMARCEIENRPTSSASEQRNVELQTVSPNYPQIAGIALVRGRELRDSDGPDSQPVALVSENFVRRYWPSEDPIARRIRIGSDQGPSPWITVVGVVKDVRYDPWMSELPSAVYRPYRQDPQYYTYIAIRAKSDPLALSAPARRAIAALDSDQPLFETERMDRVISNKIIGLSYAASMLSVLGAVAILLSAVGIYGLMAYSVAERIHEIGIRMALGAGRSDVLRLLARHGVTLAVTGLAAGLVISLVLAQLLASVIYGVSASDKESFIGAAVLLGVVAMLACYLPARRALSIDPLAALRRD